MSEKKNKPKVVNLYLKAQDCIPRPCDEDHMREERLTSGSRAWSDAAKELRDAGRSTNYCEWRKDKTIGVGYEEEEVGYFYDLSVDEKSLTAAMQEARRELVPTAFLIRDFLIELGCYVTSGFVLHRAPLREEIIFHISMITTTSSDECALSELVAYVNGFEVADPDGIDFSELSLSNLFEQPEDLNDYHHSKTLDFFEKFPLEYRDQISLSFSDLTIKDRFLSFGRKDDEGEDQWLDRVAMPEGRLEAVLKLLRFHGSFGALFYGHAKNNGLLGGIVQSQSRDWLVPGYLPVATLAMLCGERKRGKSALALQLACAIASGQRFLGADLPTSEGIVVYISGEDGVQQTMRRLRLMLNGAPVPDRLIVMEATTSSELESLIQELIENRVRVAFFVVDPASKFLNGDEKQASVANSFLEPLENLIQATGASVLVVHHVLKNAHPQTINEVHASMRGSGVLADRPRVALAIARSKSGKIFFGIPMNNGDPQHNGLPGEFREDPIELIRDPTDSMLHLLANEPGNPVSSRSDDTAKEFDRIIDAVERINAEGGKVTRTGTSGLWEQNPPELSGMSRARSRELVGELVNKGVLFIENGQLVTEESLAA